MKKFLIMLIMLLASVAASAQITIPNTFTPGTTISSSQVNSNFSTLGSDALNRTGGTITGNITVSSGVTIDGIDLSAYLNQEVLSTSSPTFGALTLTSTLGVAGNVAVNTNKFTVNATNGNILTAGTITAGSGAVQLTDSTGKIQAISSTYFANLSGTNLTGVGLLGSNNTWTARQDFKTYTETKTTANPSAGAITYDLSTGTHFETALTGNATVTISNVPSGVASFTVKFTADGTGRTFTWPGSVVWQGGSAPTFTSTNNKRDFITFITYDGGTTWFGFVAGQNY